MSSTCWSKRRGAGRHRRAPSSRPPRPTTIATPRVDLYLRLIDLLDVTVNSDMLSGTSAGGINAALLGFARSRQIDLGPLRDIWLRTGSFDLLLRDPAQKSPPSLLQGDGVLLTQLGKGIDTLAGPGVPPKPEDAADTRVFITTTLLTGETTTFTDSFGTQVSDVDYHGLFTFDAQQLAADKTKSALALAARCSASFPAAFEPAFVPCGGEQQTGVGSDHPDMQLYANTTRAHFVADGGLLMNQPIAPLLTAILDRPAERQVRRVLLYVTPTAGDPPDPEHEPTPDQFSEPYTFVQSLLKDLGAVLNQSIAADLRVLRDHKDRVRAIGDTRLRVAELGMTLGLDLLTKAALTDYSRRASTALATSIVNALMHAVTTKPQRHHATELEDGARAGKRG